MLQNLSYLDQIPIPLLITRSDELIHVNEALARFFAISRQEALATSLSALLERFADPGERAWLADMRAGEGKALPETFWVRMRAQDGRRSRVYLRVFRPAVADYDVAMLVDSESEVHSVLLTEALVRAAGELVRLRDEQHVLQAAIDAIHGQGFMVSLILLDGTNVRSVFLRFPEAVQTHLRQHFGDETTAYRHVLSNEPLLASLIRERRSAFLQDAHAMFDRQYPPELGAQLKQYCPRRLVAASIHVDDEPFALLAAHSDELRPSGAAAIELFARHVGGAVENVRHHARAAERLKQLVQLQKDLVERERLAAVGEAAAVLSHEMRNPLGAILNAITMLKRDVSLKGTSPALLSIVEEEATHLDRLVSDLLQFARPLEPRLRRLDLGEMTRTLADRVRARSHRPLDIEVVCSGRAYVEADPNLMQLAIENLLRNATQVTPLNGRVRVEFDQVGDALRLAVEDQGPSVDEVDTRRMFEPFYTTRASAGLSLAVVKRVVEAHGGEIRVGRAGLGGARFELLFPPPR